jgi:RNA polymerase sigma factor FliA
LTLNRTKVHLDDAKREMVKQNIQLVKMIASKIAIFLPRHIDYEDLIHEGLVGLMDAAIKFDEKAGMKFSSYASIRIRGSILDSLRSLDWVPRRVRKLAKKIDVVREELRQTLGREATEEEICTKMSITPAQFREIIMDVDHSQMLSFEDLRSFTSRYYASEDKIASVNPEPETTDYDRVEIKELLKVALKELGEREKLVLALYYVEDLSLKEIKQVLDISEARISQIHTAAIKKLKSSLHRKPQTNQVNSP